MDQPRPEFLRGASDGQEFAGPVGWRPPAFEF
jgi:hypothetical protein